MDPVTKLENAHSEEVAGAGGVVFDRQGNVLVLGHRNGTWVFPKGHIDPGETGLKAALREVEEEAGVVAAALDLPTHTTRYTNAQGQDRRITWYLMTTTATAPVLREATFPDGRFSPPTEARAVLSFEQDKLLLDDALRNYREAH